MPDLLAHFSDTSDDVPPVAAPVAGLGDVAAVAGGPRRRIPVKKDFGRGSASIRRGSSA